MRHPSNNGKRSVKFAAAAALSAGLMHASACTVRDIQKNVVAGSLAYVKGSTTSFWESFIPADTILQNVFNPAPSE